MKWVDDRHRLLSTIAIFAIHDPQSFGHLQRPDNVPSGWFHPDGKGLVGGIVVGDIVRGVTRSHLPDPFVLGRVVEIDPNPAKPRLLLREIGGTGTCWVSNEMWHVLRGVPADLLFEGMQWRWAELTRKVVGKLSYEHWLPRWAGMRFTGEADAVITIRAAFGGILAAGSAGIAPVEVPFHFARRTTQKQLRDALLPGVELLTQRNKEAADARKEAADALKA